MRVAMIRPRSEQGPKTRSNKVHPVPGCHGSTRVRTAHDYGMHVPTNFHIAKHIVNGLGLTEAPASSHPFTRADLLALQRAAAGSVPSPAKAKAETPLSSDRIVDALSTLADAVSYAFGSESTPGHVTVRNLLYEGSVLFGRLRAYLYFREEDAMRINRALIDRFAVPLLGVTIGEHIEGYITGPPHLARIPAVALHKWSSQRPMAHVLAGMQMRAGVENIHALLDRISWPYEPGPLYDWAKPLAEGGSQISRRMLDELCRCATESGALESEQAFGGAGSFCLRKDAPLREQASDAQKYIAGLEEKFVVDERLSPERMRNALESEGSVDEQLEVVILTDAFYRAWSVEDLRHELLCARLLEASASPLALLGEEGGGYPEEMMARMQAVAMYTACTWRRIRVGVQAHAGCSAAEAEGRMAPIVIQRGVYGREPEPEDQALYRLMRSMYSLIELDLTAEIGNEIELADPSTWSELLRGALGITGPDRPKEEGVALRVAKWVANPPASDPACVWHLVGGRYCAQTGRPKQAAQHYMKAVKQGGNVRSVAAVAMMEGVLCAAFGNDWGLAKRIHNAAVRMDLSGMGWKEYKARLNAQSLSNQCESFFPFHFKEAS